MVARKRKKKKKSNLEQGFVGVSRAIVNPQPPRLLSFIQLLLIDWTNQKREKRKQKRKEMKGTRDLILGDKLHEPQGRCIIGITRHLLQTHWPPERLSTLCLFGLWRGEVKAKRASHCTYRPAQEERKKEVGPSSPIRAPSVTRTGADQPARTHSFFYNFFFFFFIFEAIGLIKHTVIGLNLKGRNKNDLVYYFWKVLLTRLIFWCERCSQNLFINPTLRIIRT